MSLSTWESDGSSISEDDSEFNFIRGYEPIETEDQIESKSSDGETDELTHGAYFDEPLADEEWNRTYREEQAEMERRLESLKDRFSGKESLADWCSCGKCSTQFLQNPDECYCCGDDSARRLSQMSWCCVKAKLHPRALLDLHPAFRTVCLDKWPQIGKTTFM